MKLFKNYTKAEIKAANKMAFGFLFSTMNLLLNRKFKYDARTRIETLAAEIFYKEVKNLDKQKIVSIKRERKLKRPVEFSNILQNKIYSDWKKNRHALVFTDRLRIDSRNHWAKNSEDFKVLSILKKYSIK